MPRNFLYLLPLLFTALTVNAQQSPPPEYDVLKLPAVQSPLAATTLVYSISRTGDRFFAAGHRGHILYSDDFGDSWTQANVPVRSAILDIHFPTPEKGWAVGHSGVVLHSDDGGKNWVKQLDGFQLGALGLEYYKQKSAAEPDNERLAYLVEEMQYAVEQGADKPFFKVYFEDENNGYVIGAYSIRFQTHDGGQSWSPLMEQLDLYQYVHLFDFAIIGDKFILAGEMGNVLLQGSENGDFTPQEYPYEGSIFTILAVGGQQVFAGGLQGSAFYSTDGGVSWSESNKPKTGAVIDSILLSDGRVLIASNEGKLMTSEDGGVNFTTLKTDHRGRISSVIESRPGELILSGPFGLHQLNIGDS